MKTGLFVIKMFKSYYFVAHSNFSQHFSLKNKYFTGISKLHYFLTTFFLLGKIQDLQDKKKEEKITLLI